MSSSIIGATIASFTCSFDYDSRTPGVPAAACYCCRQNSAQHFTNERCNLKNASDFLFKQGIFTSESRLVPPQWTRSQPASTQFEAGRVRPLALTLIYLRTAGGKLARSRASPWCGSVCDKLPLYDAVPSHTSKFCEVGVRRTT